MQHALIAALGLPAGSVAFLEVVSDTEHFDHSQQSGRAGLRAAHEGDDPRDPSRRAP